MEQHNMRTIVKELKLAQLRIMAWLARRSPCLAMRWGLVGILAAEIQDGPDKGLPLGVALAMDAVRKS